jgi:ABC-type polysaccharide/polyol phosphate transport system ATPase subunit
MNSLIEPKVLTEAKVFDQSEAILKLENVSVRYRVPNERIGTLKEYAIRLVQQQVHFNDFLALDGINIEICQGEIFGIIGRNGAGKSTLLKVISRVLAPTNGRVWVKGRVSPLLELGAGFHPELTGRENVFLNGTLLGHTHREIEDRIEEILNFAEIGSFIEAPLRTYSSGMVARLGFAVATTWEPKILIMDEVLAVGDEAFRRKCQIRMRNFQSRGVTILLVTHDLEAARSICTRAVWLEQGTVQAIGEVHDVISAYRDSSLWQP